MTRTKNKILVLAEIAIVLCSVFLVALPAMGIAAEQNMQNTITTASEDDFILEIYGNANKDDTIDMRDTTYIKLVILGKKPETDLADANYDGKVSMLDVGQTKLIILGKEKKLTLIDLTDRIVTVNKPVERMVTTGYIVLKNTPMAFDLEKIVGWSQSPFKDNRRWFWEKYKEKFPEIEDIPDVGYPTKGTFSVEKVITLKPDVVFMAKWEQGYTDVWTKLEPADITVVFVNHKTNEAAIKSTLLLGYVFDKEERAQELVEFFNGQVNMVYSRLEEIDKPKPKVYIECGSKGPSTYGGTSGNYYHGAIVEWAGGINIAKALFEKSGTINPEYVLDANPDVIIITGSNWPKSPGSMKLGYYANPEESKEILKAFTKRQGWDTLNAVKNKRVYSIHHMIASNTFEFVELQYFAKCFYPDEFEDLDPEKNFKEFHEKFLPVDYSGVWMMSIEEEYA